MRTLSWTTGEKATPAESWADQSFTTGQQEPCRTLGEATTAVCGDFGG